MRIRQRTISFHLHKSGGAGGVYEVKFLFDNQGPGRFAKMGLPAAPQLAHFVGGVEVVGGALLVASHMPVLAASEA